NNKNNDGGDDDDNDDDNDDNDDNDNNNNDDNGDNDNNNNNDNGDNDNNNNNDNGDNGDDDNNDNSDNNNDNKSLAPALFPRDHTATIIAGTWIKAQRDSPYAGTLAPQIRQICKTVLCPLLGSPFATQLIADGEEVEERATAQDLSDSDSSSEESSP
ncbi:hypothetical protein QQS21_012943, partial [Conoideocrella luteorostrata]